MSTDSKNSESSGTPVRQLTVKDIAARKGGDPVVSLTAYGARMAELLDPHCDIILVGDSLGMVLYGLESTLGVDLEMMIRHGQAVVRGARRAMVVIDMPFSSYEESKEQAFRNAARVMTETGAQAIKLEGGRRMAETIGFLVERGIPVMAHIGLTPQSVHALGGYRAQGRDEAEWNGVIEDAKAVARAGAFSTVIEGVAEPLAQRITESVPNITIGIGASAVCDGQVLVTDDMLGMFPRTPKFVKTFTDLGAQIEGAAKAYATAVHARTFPADEHTYTMRKKAVQDGSEGGNA